MDKLTDMEVTEMENEPLVSVIIPVYKTQPYLPRCVNSVLNQTYRNLQIILVDDGSPDNCGKICDEFKENDSRVEVIHTENKGVAAARNTGLLAAKGEWISWVDSDDWIENDMIEYLLCNALKYRADVTVCGHNIFQEQKTYSNSVNEVTVYTTEQALHLLLDIQCHTMENYLWDKLYNRSVFDGISFFEGKNFEDFSVLYKLIERSNLIVCLPEVKYNYLQHEGSIMKDNSIKNKLDHYDAAKNRYDYLIEKWPQFKKLLVNRCIRMANRVWKSYCSASKEEHTYANDRMKEISAFLTPFINEGYCPDDYGMADRMIVKLVRYPYAWAYIEVDIINKLFQLKKGFYKEDIYFGIERIFTFPRSFFCSAYEFLEYGNVRRNARYIKAVRECPVKENMILYDSFWGRGAMCNPYALFRYLLDNPDYADLEHVWVLSGPSDYPDTLEKYSKYPNVRFVHYMQRDHLCALGEAKYLITNTALHRLFIKKDGQVVINTWHGIPLKKIGPDVEGGVLESGNAIRNFLAADYMISANPFMSEMYNRTYGLHDLYAGELIEEGYPRLDTLVRESEKSYTDQLLRMGVCIDKSKKVIIYAPTWRDPYNNQNDITRITEEYRRVKEQIEAACSGYQVLVKVHQFVYQLLKGKSIPSYIIPATVDANEVLPAADILLADYSSIFFDYLYFERPILFYIPDISSYSNYRGFYFKIDELPGPASEKIEDVTGWIGNIEEVHKQYLPRIREAKKWCCDYEVGNISKRVSDIMFRNRRTGTKHKSAGNVKKKVLIQTGSLESETLVYTLLSMQKNIDWNVYDVTIAVPETKKWTDEKICGHIDKRIRVIGQDRHPDLTFKDSLRIKLADIEGIKRNNKAGFRRVCQEETTRRYAGCDFDLAFHLGDYSAIDLMVTAMLRGEDCAARDFDAEMQNKLAADLFLRSLI